MYNHCRYPVPYTRYSTTGKRTEEVTAITRSLKTHHLHLKGFTLHLLVGDFTHRRCSIVIVVAVDIFVLLRKVLESIVIFVKLKMERSILDIGDITVDRLREKHEATILTFGV